MEKLTVKESAEIRASLYDTTLTALNEPVMQPKH